MVSLSEANPSFRGLTYPPELTARGPSILLASLTIGSKLSARGSLTGWVGISVVPAGTSEGRSAGEGFDVDEVRGVEDEGGGGRLAWRKEVVCRERRR